MGKTGPDKGRDRMSLGEQYPIEQARCRKLLQDSRGVRPAEQLGRVMIEKILDRADKAALEGKLTIMRRCYEEMKLCK